MDYENDEADESAITTCYYIRRRGEPDSYWSSREGWTDRTHADLHGHLSLSSPAIQVPADGVWVDSYYGSLEEYYDRQEDAGIKVDPAIRPGFPFRRNGRHVPEYSLDEYLNGAVGQKK